MNDELREKDPPAPDKERGWMEVDPVATATVIAVILILALSIAGYVSFALDHQPKKAAVAKRHDG